MKGKALPWWAWVIVIFTFGILFLFGVREARKGRQVPNGESTPPAMVTMA
jgi:hypothetical protein